MLSMSRVVHTVVMSDVSPQSKGPRKAPGHNIRKRLEAQVSKIQKKRTAMEDRRQRQLWRMANTIDELVRQELDRDATDTDIVAVDFVVDVADPFDDPFDVQTTQDDV